MTHHQNPEAAKQIKWAKNRESKAMSLLEMIDKLEQYSTYKPCELGMPDDATWPSIYTTWNSNCKIPFLPTMDQDFYPVIKAGRHQVGRDILCITAYHIYSILRNESKLYSALNRLCPTKSSAVESNRKGAQKLIADCLFLFAEGGSPASYVNACHKSLGFIWQDRYNGIQHRNCGKRPMWETEEQNWELKCSEDGSCARGKYPSNISTVVARVWRTYFTLIQHMNHPAPWLENKQVKSSRFSDYSLVASYWEEFRIDI